MTFNMTTNQNTVPSGESEVEMQQEQPLAKIPIEALYKLSRQEVGGMEILRPRAGRQGQSLGEESGGYAGLPAYQGRLQGSPDAGSGNCIVERYKIPGFQTASACQAIEKAESDLYLQDMRVAK